VRLAISSVWGLLGRMGWSVQRPTGQARQRDKRAIITWKNKRWPELKNRSATATSHRVHRRVGFVRALACAPCNDAPPSCPHSGNRQSCFESYPFTEVSIVQNLE
jgi:hypothetical protein